MHIPDPQQHADLRRNTRTFCETEVRPALLIHERDETFPLELFRKMGPRGYLGCTVAKEQGGAGLDDWEYAVVLEEFGRYQSVRQIVSVQRTINHALLDFAEPALRDAYLPRMARGELLSAYALTEPTSGSDARGMRLRAERRGGEWVLNGQKTFITLGNSADVFLTFARSKVEGSDAGITAFLVERAWGVQTSPLKGKLGQRASDTAAVFFEDVRVPDTNRVGQIGEGFKIAMVALDYGRLDVAAAATGTCQTSLDLSTAYALERQQFGRPIASFQLVQDHIAQMVVDTDASRMLTVRAIATKLAGGPFTKESAVAKYFASEAAVRCTNRAIQVHGGYGYYEDYEVERLARDARILTIYDGTSEIQKLLIASHHTGIKGFA